MKQDYELSEEDFNKILEINKKGGDPVMFLSGGMPIGRSLQEKINEFWRELGKNNKFDWQTIEPITDRKFKAEPIEEVSK